MKPKKVKFSVWTFGTGSRKGQFFGWVCGVSLSVVIDNVLGQPK